MLREKDESSSEEEESEEGKEEEEEAEQEEEEQEEEEQEDFEKDLRYGGWKLVSKHYFNSGNSKGQTLSSACFNASKNILGR